MLTNYFETFTLSFIQGVSEFLPISSSAHLLLTSKLFNYKSSTLIIDISLHLGSLLAIIFYFRKDLINFFQNKNLALLIIFGSIPLIVFGFVLHASNLIYYLRNIEIIAWTTLIFGILLYFSDRFKIKKSFDNDLNLKNILIIEKNSTKLEAIIFQNKGSIFQLKKKIHKSTLLLILDGELQVDLFEDEFKKEYRNYCNHWKNWTRIIYD